MECNWLAGGWGSHATFAANSQTTSCMFLADWLIGWLIDCRIVCSWQSKRTNYGVMKKHTTKQSVKPHELPPNCAWTVRQNVMLWLLLLIATGLQQMSGKCKYQKSLLKFCFWWDLTVCFRLSPIMHLIAYYLKLFPFRITGDRQLVFYMLTVYVSVNRLHLSNINQIVKHFANTADLCIFIWLRWM